MSIIKDEDLLSLNAKLKLREDDYLIKENIKIFCGTYNLKGRNLDESLLPWFCLHEPCDLYVLGFQELCELSTTSLLLNNDWIEREQSLIENLKITLCTNKKLNLEFLKSIRLWGIALVIFVKADLVKSISDIRLDDVATGILNTLGNKGTVAISFKIYETRFCFLSSHFASDTDQLERRNSDYQYTVKSLKFYPSINDEINRDFIEFDAHDFTVWLGDFNYRLNNLPLDQTLDLIYKNDFDNLIKYDQLSNQMREKKVFHDFQEGKIKFKPTYKYIVKEDRYDMITNSDGQTTISGRGSSKVKLPSWTDRVLWKISEATTAKLLQYSSINTITISDHKPVYGIFKVECKSVDEKKKKEISDSILKESDRKKNEEIPHIRLLTQPPLLNFGPLTYYQLKKLEFEIKNDGKTIATIDTEMHIDEKKLTADQIQFVNNHFGSTASITSKNLTLLLNQWFKIKPSRKERLRQDECFKFEVINEFLQTNISRLNDQKNLDDILVIKCLNGNDLFINVCCEYVRTVMGVSLKTLSCLDNNKPFKEYDYKIIKNLEDETSAVEYSIDNIVKYEFEGTRQRLSNPLESSLKYIKEVIESKDKHFHQSLSIVYTNYLNVLIKRSEEYLKNEDSVEKTDIQMSIDAQKDLILTSLSTANFEIFNKNNFDIEILLEVLCDLLNCLPNALIPRRYFDLCIALNSNYQCCLEIIKCLPKSHATLFYLIIKFINSYSKANEINYDGIARAIFQSDNKVFQKSFNDSNFVDKTIIKFLKNFIENYDLLSIYADSL